MKNKKILAIDIGTSSVKAALIGKKGQIFAHERISLVKVSGASYKDKWLFDSYRWISAIKKLCAGMDFGEVAALCVTGHGPSIVPVKKNGKATGPALMWNKPVEQRGYKSAYLPRIEWYVDNTLFAEKPDFFLGVPEFVSFYLGAEPVMFSPSPEFDSLIWSYEEKKASGLEEYLPVGIARTGNLCGLTGNSAKALGIPASIPVVAGASDFIMAIVGCNVLTERKVCNRAGTSEGINFALSMPCKLDGIRNTPHPAEGLYNAGLVIPASGSIFEWFKNLTGRSSVSYLEIVKHAEKLWDKNWLKRKGPFIFPHNKGGVTDASFGDFVGLDSSFSPDVVFAALLESLLFMVRDAFSVFYSAEVYPSDIVLCGGQALNMPWVRARADVLGRTISVPSICDAELAGAAAYSFLALGDFSSLYDAASSVFSVRTMVSPSEEKVDFWNKAYQYYSSFRYSS
ncbi:FGGY-family carbohydrate kinase [Spirochaetia bacterium 38H-sp]|uniref:FGGY-family carbohydrate kinase n=1 Tax=Rarispira pelagica TaxID=3141764 RepID=A0ABU9UCN3_9SPIR